MKEAVIPTLEAGSSYASSTSYTYWLRSVGKRFCIKTVSAWGGIDNVVRYDEKRIGVRPVMWVEMGE